MIRIGILGDIGSGKSYIANSFGYPVFNADYQVKKIYKKNINCFRKLNRKFPNNIKSFPIIKSEIKKILNKKNIIILSKIVHPYVRHELIKFLKKNNSKKYVILDIPLMIENKLNRKSDILIYVKTSRSIILKRLKKRGNYNKKIINILKTKQINTKKKIKLANFIIYNNLNKKNVLNQIKQIKKKFND
tara:strand:+ start:961 stop:1527 length:567 start_codon:yes stop_codon:yes gene_type:complete